MLCPVVWKTAPHLSASCSLGSSVYNNPTYSCPLPQGAKGEVPRASRQHLYRSQWGEVGRCSPGHSFQEDCRYEHAVPSDGSLAVSAAQEGLQLPFFTQESAFLSIFQKSFSESGSISVFHGNVAVLASYWIFFAKAESPQSNDLARGLQAGLANAGFTGQAGSVRKAKGKVGIIAARNVLRERANWNNPFVMPNHTIIIFFPLNTKGKS